MTGTFPHLNPSASPRLCASAFKIGRIATEKNAVTRRHRGAEKLFEVIFYFFIFCFVYVVFFSSTVLYSLDVQEQMHLAEAYFETQQYLQAQQIYEKLKKEKLEPWEKAIIAYNLECCLLAGRQWQPLATDINEVLLQTNTYPLLERNAELNYAILLLNEAEALKSDPKAIPLIKEALVSLHAVEENDCEIYQQEGYPSCPEVADTIALKSQAEQLLKELSAGKRAPKSASSGPRGILEKAIEEQQAAQWQTLQIKQAKASEEISKELNAEALEAQQGTLMTATSFVGAVLSQEKAAFQKSCQDKPWDQVIPLFQDGNKAANQANISLIKADYRSALRNQMIALNHWKAALDLVKRAEAIQAPSPSNPEEKPQGGQPNAPTSSLNQVLQLMEEMGAEDRLHPSLHPNAKEVVRPW